ncbi:MAG TPA: ABC transporter substrate-binding protein [Methanospirillum sp.]|uniref:ABC transporter substrate-binding protein n=1 Tax=Methanospirillum sp. TaxID=45200 RepID=UPI002B943AFC|nr:ABC transporter substrate-binding protein [Methanospirillum sp.]HWQ64988.1 ABC transporter substrate-binding protein [Methanospirillum sp.]
MFAQETSSQSQKDLKENGKLVVGLCAQYPPFESVNDKTGVVEGFDVDLAKAIGKEMGLNVTIVDAQWQALLGGLDKGDYDVLITAMSKQEASAGNVGMSDPYYNLSEIIAVRSDDDSIKSPADLAGKVVGVQSSTGAEQQVDKLTGLKEVKRYDYNNDAFIDLVNKRIDAVVVGYAYAVTEAKNREGLKVINTPVGEPSELVMVTSKKSDSLLKELNQALGTIKQNGTYQKIVDSWLNLS